MGPASAAYDHDDFDDLNHHDLNHHDLNHYDLNHYDFDHDHRAADDDDASTGTAAHGGWLRHFVAAVLPVLACKAGLRDRGDQQRLGVLRQSVSGAGVLLGHCCVEIPGPVHEYRRPRIAERPLDDARPQALQWSIGGPWLCLQLRVERSKSRLHVCHVTARGRDNLVA